MSRGIYLVANLKSQTICENLIYSIRQSGCNLPIRLIHFGGEKVDSKYILKQVEFLRFEDFPKEARELVLSLRSVLTDCPLGFLYRFLAWYTDWDEFIYSDNDIVALCNWEILFDYIEENDLVHADEEYTTKGIYNYNKPEKIPSIFGEHSLESAMTAGHIIVKKSDKMVSDISKAIQWFKDNPDIPKMHDQSLMHIASLLGNWKTLNLCKSKNWLSSWAGDYKNSLDLVQKIQKNFNRISHLHYSGFYPKGDLAIQDFIFSSVTSKERLLYLFFRGLKLFSGYNTISDQYIRFKRFFKRKVLKK